MQMNLPPASIDLCYRNADMSNNYLNPGPTREELDKLSGPAIVQFGTDWCGYCQAAEPTIEAALRAYPDLRRIKVEDGKGRRLGRTFSVKLWPTLIFLKDGVEVSRVVRPDSEEEIAEALALLL